MQHKLHTIVNIIWFVHIYAALPKREEIKKTDIASAKYSPLNCHDTKRHHAMHNATDESNHSIDITTLYSDYFQYRFRSARKLDTVALNTSVIEENMNLYLILL